MEPRSIGTDIRHGSSRPIELAAIRANVLAIGGLVERDRVVGNVEVIVYGIVLVGGAGEDVGEAGAGGVVAAVDGHFGVGGVAGGVGADGCCWGLLVWKMEEAWKKRTYRQQRGHKGTKPETVAKRRHQANKRDLGPLS